MHARERYWGNFNVTTKTPILYVNGEFDPVTPLANAYEASAGFEGSVVLPHSGYGHGIFAHPSQYVASYVQAYFKDATLPGVDAHCEPDMSLLQVWKASVQATKDGSTSGGDGNGTVADFEGAAIRGSTTSVWLAFAAMLMVAAINVL